MALKDYLAFLGFWGGIFLACFGFTYATLSAVFFFITH